LIPLANPGGQAGLVLSALDHFAPPGAFPHYQQFQVLSADHNGSYLHVPGSMSLKERCSLEASLHSLNMNAVIEKLP
jgi:hypothetical protein